MTNTDNVLDNENISNDKINENNNLITLNEIKNNLSDIVYQIENEDDPNTYDIYNFICHYSILLLSFTLVLSICSWLIFSILALCDVSYKSIKNECPNSNLWSLLFVLVLYTVINIILFIQENNNNNNHNNKRFIIKFILGTIITIWCGIELFNNCSFHNLKHNNIYILTEIYFWTSISLITILVSCNITVYYILYNFK